MILFLPTSHIMSSEAGSQTKNEEKLIEEKPCFFNGEYIPLKNANINIRTHALQYGTAAFGGLRGYYNAEKNNIYGFRFHDHFKRLTESAKILQMQIPYSIEELVDIAVTLIARGGWRQNVYLRPMVYKSALELSPRLHNVENGFLIYVIPLNDYMDIEKGLEVMVSSWVRIHDNQIPTRAKAAGGYVNSALAKSEALQSGYDEALFLDINGNVSEASAANLFIVKNGTLITAGLADSILEGITRRTILELAESSGIKTEIRHITRSELYTADEVFLAGTGVQIAWVKTIDRRQVGTGERGSITEQIARAFFTAVNAENNSQSGWLTPVYS